MRLSDDLGSHCSGARGESRNEEDLENLKEEVPGLCLELGLRCSWLA
jgi:hypothetical protein